ncbi:uncharacterized protein LOC131478068 [Ochotona princeps]|uniref:uncharacterized protein LOC131478068 n=1 Tax=Ochotona princeps TaxID=9978 RepID=UPI002715526B|nr:uncharacterized protein LOC131478068 [Ochotona princeps]
MELKGWGAEEPLHPGKSYPVPGRPGLPSVLGWETSVPRGRSALSWTPTGPRRPPVKARPRGERCNPKVGWPGPSRLRPEREVALRALEAGGGVESPAPAAAQLHLLQRRCAPAYQGRARRGSLPPAPVARAVQQRRGTRGTVPAERPGDGVPGKLLRQPDAEQRGGQEGGPNARPPLHTVRQSRRLDQFQPLSSCSRVGNSRGQREDITTRTQRGLPCPGHPADHAS